MRNFLLALLIGALLLGAILLIGMSQNDGCLPWQESVGNQGSPFSETEDQTVCR